MVPVDTCIDLDVSECSRDASIQEMLSILRLDLERLEARLRKLEPCPFSLGDERTLAMVQHDIEHIEARVKTELAHVAATSATKDDVDDRFADLTMSITRSVKAVTEDLAEMRHVIALDMVTVALGGVRTISDLKTSGWIRDVSQPTQTLDTDDDVEAIVSEGSESNRNSVDSFARVDFSTEVTEERLDTLRLRTTVAQAFRQTKRFSRMQAGSSYELKLSVWDGSLFFCLHGFRFVDHFLLGLAFVVNAVLQAALCVVVYHMGIDSRKRFTDARLDSLDHWRLEASETELAGVCGLDFSLATSYLQLSTREDVEDYTELVFAGFPVGPVLCRVVMILWSSTIVTLIRDLVDMSVAVVQLTDWTSTRTMISQGLLTCTIYSIPPKRLVWMLFIVFLQLAVLITLLIYGSLWLVNTTQLSELLLNSVALRFITDTDELLFVALVPSIVKGMTSRTVPLSLTPPRRLPPLRSIVSACLLITVVVVIDFIAVSDVMDRLRRVDEALCL
uniref:Transmembrane protein n=1 Tax=Noctiluca scintillans TaxID=2966 RepID=A0A7S1A9Z0_NOCSC|mmetsp:Transcript_37728/g.100382  ORF Transcript_37728/g.100382 Transcript_37728/m.100382 type:complete len:505 (+) Transcript_37728:114-1628(+)